MTEQEWAIVEDYVRQIADLLKLKDWRFVLLRTETPDNPANGMEVASLFGRHVAYLRFCTDFRELRPEVQRHAIVHELIHCHVNPVCHVVTFDLKNAGLLSDPTYQFINQNLTRADEYCVDDLAEAFSQFLLLIPWENNPSSTEEAAQ
jgi:hypothetical protein